MYQMSSQTPRNNSPTKPTAALTKNPATRTSCSARLACSAHGRPCIPHSRTRATTTPMR
ncbi:Uncharacterised protein [Mycobacteroides abscessus subsp. abscessus]|nr:Uncharacterised protein [Mycobacteroides abscessus subsp. abscessus]